MTDHQIQAALILAILAFFYFGMRGDGPELEDGSIVWKVGLVLIGIILIVIDATWFVFDGIVGR